MKMGVAHVGGWSSTSTTVSRRVGSSPTVSKKGVAHVGGWSSSAVGKSAFVVALLEILTIKYKATNTCTLLFLSLFPFLIP